MKTVEHIQANGYQAKVTRTAKAKAATIKIEEGVVTLVVPKALATKRIEGILKDEHQWITKNVALHKVQGTTDKKQFISGEAMPYLGRNYPLKVLTGNFEPVKLVQGRLVTTVPQGSARPDLVREALVGWYKQQALTKLKQKVRRYGKMMGVTPTSIVIMAFKSRWGSCNSRGELDFNWVIIMAPNRIVDYLVIHELSHLKYLDHSSLFWAEVAKMMPDYRECKEWLKINSAKLDI